MAEMALGYGSEYQLFRFLGHHRDELESCILKQTKINENLDYFLQEKINEAYTYLGLTNEAKKYISEIFVEC